MSDTRPLRAAISGLLSFAAAEEQTLLAALADGEGGSPDRWAAVPLVAHNNQFKDQQAERIVGLRSGRVPPTFTEVDHSSAEVYLGYCAKPRGEVLLESRRVSEELIDGTWALGHGQPERAVALQEHGLATARYLRAPGPAAGMAGYSLACALARAGRPDEAGARLAEAIEANPDLRVNAGRDPDLAGVREAGLVEALR